MFKLLTILVGFAIFSCNSGSTSLKEPRRSESGEILADSLKLDKRRLIDSAYDKRVKRIQPNSYLANHTERLKGNYLVKFDYYKYCQYVILKKDNQVIDTIASYSLDSSHNILAYIVADFDKTFVFLELFGNENAHMVQLYDKATGGNLLPGGSAWIGVDTSSETLLYSRNVAPTDKDSMTFFDTRRKRLIEFPFPEEMFAEPNLLRRIRLINAAEKGFTIDYIVNGELRVRKYGH